MRPYSILVAGKANYTQNLLITHLLREGFTIKGAGDRLDVLLSSVSEKNTALVILNVGMCKLDTIELCTQIRNSSSIPIILLVAENETEVGIAGLNAGADSFILMPIRINPVLAQIKAVLRRRDLQLDSLNTRSIEGVELAYRQRTIRYNGARIMLSEKEMILLWYLASQPGKVFTREYLLSKFEDESDRKPRLIDSYIKCIRLKLKQVTNQLEIKTVWSIGYKLTIQLDVLKKVANKLNF